MSKEKKDKHFIKKPFYEGGRTAMKEFITKEMRYPKDAFDQKIEGTVSVRYSIDHRGKVTEVKVISGPGYGCEEEAERLVKLLQFKVPKSRGVKVLFQKTLQIHFRLPKEKAPVAQTQEKQIQYNYTTKKKPQTEVPEKPKGYGYTIEW